MKRYAVAPRQGICVVLLATLLMIIQLAACASPRNPPAPSSADSSDSQSSDNALPPSPDAKVHISYSRPGDFLSSLIVTKYSSAEPLLAIPGGKDGSAAIVRFEGGIVVWQIAVEKSLLNSMPLIGKDQPYAVTEVKYGTMPRHFVATIPDSGPPEPLESDHYYVFTVTRASGISSYEAVKVNGDGTLEAYAAEPRAGTSFRLCCNISPDFVITANSVPNPAEGP
jgi:hypothetical protein